MKEKTLDHIVGAIRRGDARLEILNSMSDYLNCTGMRAGLILDAMAVDPQAVEKIEVILRTANDLADAGNKLYNINGLEKTGQDIIDASDDCHKLAAKLRTDMKDRPPTMKGKTEGLIRVTLLRTILAKATAIGFQGAA